MLFCISCNIIIKIVHIYTIIHVNKIHKMYKLIEYYLPSICKSLWLKYFLGVIFFVLS